MASIFKNLLVRFKVDADFAPSVAAPVTDHRQPKTKPSGAPEHGASAEWPAKPWTGAADYSVAIRPQTGATVGGERTRRQSLGGPSARARYSLAGAVITPCRNTVIGRSSTPRIRLIVSQVSLKDRLVVRCVRRRRIRFACV
jgi:hypothetical protein